MVKFEVIRGQGGQSFDLKLAKAYVLCYGPCKLPFDMLQPIILAIVVQTIHEVKIRSEVKSWS